MANVYLSKYHESRRADLPPEITLSGMLAEKFDEVLAQLDGKAPAVLADAGA